MLAKYIFTNMSAAGKKSSEHLLSDAKSGLCKIYNFFLNAQIATLGGVTVL